ncbi:MAG: putative membrane protein [Arenicella sp.]|jgi:uncharacterized membrane protein
MMSTHATASKQWTELELNLLPIENNVRLRGLEVTRLDTFIDAAFAFVLTLLVISFDQIPSNYDEMIVAVKRIPGFSASFSVLMIFWLSHRGWSRKYGLESGRSIFLSLAIIFMILVYIYPLRIIFEAMFWSLSSGYFTADFRVQSIYELRGMIVFYSSGAFMMAVLFCDLYRTALNRKSSLALNAAEQLVTKRFIRSWLVGLLFSILSLVLACSLPDDLVALAGYVYLFVYPAVWWVSRLAKAEITAPVNTG